jgi:putative RecB family exonuclease
VADSPNCRLRAVARGLSVGSPTLAAMTEHPATADAVACAVPNAASKNAPEAPRRPALSPSRAADFKQCPLLYRFRAIDRLPERPSRAQVRGTLVHAVLERLYDLPADARHPAAAHALLAPEWARLCSEMPELLESLFTGPDDPELAEWLASAEPLLDTYFRLEDPRRLEPDARELLVESELPSGLLLRGYVDRLDVGSGGELRIVDYKTGAAPRPVAEARALFQMKFYALVLLYLRGTVPAQLRLLYLTDGESLTYEPDEVQLHRFARTVEAIWTAILAAGADGDFRPNPSRFCEWCSHQALCPAWGGLPPAYPGWPGDPAEETPADRAG